MLGLWQHRAAAAPRPQEGEGRETGSLRGRGLLPAGRGQDWGDPHPTWGSCPASGRYVGPPASARGGSGLCWRGDRARCPLLAPWQHPARHNAALWPGGGAHWGTLLGGLAHPEQRVPCQPVPTRRRQQPCRRLESCPRCLLPACACGTWLGMNVAKQGGSAPARSRHGERHTRPCALSRGGPGRRRGTRAAAEREGCGRVPGHHVPSQLGLAQPGPRRGAVALPAATLARWGQTARPGTAWGCESCRSPSCHPTVPMGGGWGLCVSCSPPAGTSGADASGRETPSRWQQMSPTGAPSEQGAGREINSGVSSCPGWGGRGGEWGDPPVPPGLSPAQWHGRLWPPRDYCFSQKSPFFFRDG